MALKLIRNRLPYDEFGELWPRCLLPFDCFLRLCLLVRCPVHRSTPNDPASLEPFAVDAGHAALPGGFWCSRCSWCSMSFSELRPKTKFSSDKFPIVLDRYVSNTIPIQSSFIFLIDASSISSNCIEMGPVLGEPPQRPKDRWNQKFYRIDHLRLRGHF